MSVLSSLKPVLTALLLPPVPLIVLILVSIRLMLGTTGKSRFLAPRPVGVLLALIACSGLWLTATQGFARTVMDYALQPPPPLQVEDILRLRIAARREPSTIAIVVLGGGRDAMAPEYRRPELRALSLERLRYGVWLSRQTGVPLAFSGGVGWADSGDGLPEARIAERVALQDFGRPLRWIEGTSRDTRENASYSVQLLHQTGVERIVLVTHAWHMPRALRAFRNAAGGDVLVEAAPLGYFGEPGSALLEWLPSAEGMLHSRWVMRELAGLLLGS